MRARACVRVKGWGGDGNRWERKWSGRETRTGWYWLAFTFFRVRRSERVSKISISKSVYRHGFRRNRRRRSGITNNTLHVKSVYTHVCTTGRAPPTDWRPGRYRIRFRVCVHSLPCMGALRKDSHVKRFRRRNTCYVSYFRSCPDRTAFFSIVCTTGFCFDCRIAVDDRREPSYNRIRLKNYTRVPIRIYLFFT